MCKIPPLPFPLFSLYRQRRQTDRAPKLYVLHSSPSLALQTIYSAIHLSPNTGRRTQASKMQSPFPFTPLPLLYQFPSLHQTKFNFSMTYSHPLFSPLSPIHRTNQCFVSKTNKFGKPHCFKTSNCDENIFFL